MDSRNTPRAPSSLHHPDGSRPDSEDELDSLVPGAQNSSSEEENQGFDTPLSESQSDFDSAENILHAEGPTDSSSITANVNVNEMHQDLDETDLLLDKIEMDVKRLAVVQELYQPKYENPEPLISTLKAVSIMPSRTEPPFSFHTNKLETHIHYAERCLLLAKSVLTQRIILSSTSSIGIMEAWETVLIQSLIELKPPKFRKEELKEYLAIKLREIADDMDYICQILMKVTINSRVGFNMISKVWRRVLDNAKAKGLKYKTAPAPYQDSMAQSELKKADKKMVEKSILELTDEGLKLFNIKEPISVDYDDFTYLERKAVLHSFITEIQIVVCQASNVASKLFILTTDFHSTLQKFREKPKCNPKILSPNLIEREILELDRLVSVKNQVIDLSQLERVQNEMDHFCKLCEHVTSIFKTSACGYIQIEKKQQSLLRGNHAKLIRKFQPDERLLLAFTLSTTGLIQQQEINQMLRGVGNTQNIGMEYENTPGSSTARVSGSDQDNSTAHAHSTKSTKTVLSRKKERIISPVDSSTETLSDYPGKPKRSWIFWKGKQNAAATTG